MKYHLSKPAYGHRIWSFSLRQSTSSKNRIDSTNDIISEPSVIDTRLQRLSHFIDDKTVRGSQTAFTNKAKQLRENMRWEYTITVVGLVWEPRCIKIQRPILM